MRSIAATRARVYLHGGAVQVRDDKIGQAGSRELRRARRPRRRPRRHVRDVAGPPCVGGLPRGVSERRASPPRPRSAPPGPTQPGCRELGSSPPAPTISPSFLRLIFSNPQTCCVSVRLIVVFCIPSVFLFLRACFAPPAVVTAVLRNHRDHARGRSFPFSRSSATKSLSPSRCPKATAPLPSRAFEARWSSASNHLINLGKKGGRSLKRHHRGKLHSRVATMIRPLYA